MNELIPKDLQGGPLVDADFDSIVKSALDFLPRFQLFSSKSDACAEGRIGIGRYGLVKGDDIADLGDSVDVGILAWRPKAIRIEGDTVINAYYPDIKDGIITNQLFKEIVNESAKRDSGCMYGPEFFIWVPSANAFALYHANNKTARREAKKLHPLISSVATFRARLIEKGRYKWHGPVITQCSAPIDPPNEKLLRAEWETFHNPPKDTVEVAIDSDGRAQ